MKQVYNDLSQVAAWNAAFGRTLVRMRKEQGLTREVLADIIGVAPNTVLSWEAGRTSVSGFALQRLELALGCNLYDLLPEVET